MRISAATRVTIGLVALAISVWSIAFALGMVPDRQRAVVAGRAALCENVALNCSLLASRNDWRTIETSLDGLVKRNGDVQSAAVRHPDGTLMVSAGPHAGHWNLPGGNQSTESQMRLPILSGDSEWGTVEVRFGDTSAKSVSAWLRHPLVVLAAFVAAVTYLLYFFYLHKTLPNRDPSQVLPNRVGETLDRLAEGLLLLDENERILLTNRALAEGLGTSADALIGRKVSELPWQRAMQSDSPQNDELSTENHATQCLETC